MTNPMQNAERDMDPDEREIYEGVMQDVEDWTPDVAKDTGGGKR